MAVGTALSLAQDFTTELDELLFGVCELLQLTRTKHEQAVERYESLGDVLEGEGSPFELLRPRIYPQGSMALGTTVKPVEGPHDLDFVLELSLAHDRVDPMKLISCLYQFLKGHGVYGPMTKPKNRCVRVEYANDFYMDVLPACRNLAGTSTCLKVPDRARATWCDSNPKGYIEWFETRSRATFIGIILDKAEPVPPLAAVGDKKPLQLGVQLIKRWRDLYYDDCRLAPISVVLTTLAAHAYNSERSVSKGLTSILGGIVRLIDIATAEKRRLRVWNPSNRAEDLSERWDENPAAYHAFERGIRDFHRRWSALVTRGGNVDAELKALFGEQVTAVRLKQAKQLQSTRQAGNLGVNSMGLLGSIGASRVPVQRNTFHGSK